MKKFPTLLILIFLFSEYNFSQNSEIKIDKSVAAEMDSLKIISETSNSGHPEIDSMMNAHFPATKFQIGDFLFHIDSTYNYSDFQLDDASDLSYFLEIQATLNQPYILSLCDCTLKNDTIIISGGMGYEGGILFKINFSKDTLGIIVYLETKEDIYSMSKNKQSLGNAIKLKSIDQQLTLFEMPTFKIDEEIKGKVHFQAEPFYQLSNKKKLVLTNTEYDLLFNCILKKHSQIKMD